MNGPRRHLPLLAALAILATACPRAPAQDVKAPTPAATTPDARRPAVPSVPVLHKWTADPDAPFLDFANAWPPRVMIDGKPGIIRDIPGPTRGWNQRFGFVQPIEPSPEDHEDEAFLKAALKSDLPVAFEPKGGYLVEFDGRKEGLFAQKVKKSDRPVMAFKYISAERETRPARKGPEDVLAIQRTSFVFYEPYADADALDGVLKFEQCRGVALVMPGLFGTPDTVVDVMVRRLRQERWYVLRLLSASSRFTQTVSYDIDAKGDLDKTARDLASSLGNRAAEIAYAVEAAFAHVFHARPELAHCPRVAIGSSAGAITLPTVLARDPAAYKAAVLIGAGADYWLINSRSNYRRGVDAIRMNWLRGEPEEAQERTLDQLYLSHAPLDPYHTAKALRGKPILMIHGAVDRAVPAALGDLLWHRLGKPDRWVLQVGHEMLFASVAGQLTEISDWLSKAADGPPAPPQPDNPPAHAPDHTK